MRWRKARLETINEKSEQERNNGQSGKEWFSGKNKIASDF